MRKERHVQVAVGYEEAAGRRYPEQIALAIVKDAKGKYNPITLGWITPASQEPPMMAIAIGKGRWSYEAIRQSGEFVVCLPSSEQAAEAVLFGTKSGREMDKLAEAGTRTQPAQKIDGVLLVDAVANFECKLVGELETGDHVLFVGEVVAAHVNEDRSVRRLFSLGNERMSAVTGE